MKTAAQVKEEMIKVIDEQISGVKADPTWFWVFDDFDVDQLKKVKRFIESFGDEDG